MVMSPDTLEKVVMPVQEVELSPACVTLSLNPVTICIVSAALQLLAAAAATGRVVRYITQLHCTVCTVAVHSVQGRGDTGSVHQLSTARSKVWCVQIPATRHRRPMT